jgi:heterodisulfide reductase subunit C
VEITDIIMIMRNMAVERGYMQKPQAQVADLFCKTGHLLLLKEEQMKMRESLGLQATPPTVLSNKNSQAIVLKIMEETGFSALVAKVKK